MSFVLLTGGSRGIGRATALALAHRECSLVLLGRPSPELEATRAAVAKYPVEVEVFACDLADACSVDHAALQVQSRWGAPIVLINDAAVIRRAPVEATTLEDWNEQLAVNLRAPFQLTRSVLPGMREQGRGRILNVGSIASTLGTARSAAYNASKWGLVGFTKSLAEELRDSGLMTVAVLPGSVDTRMLDGSGFEPRMTPEDVAKTLVYFALDAPIAHNGAIVEMFGT